MPLLGKCSLKILLLGFGGSFSHFRDLFFTFSKLPGRKNLLLAMELLCKLCVFRMSFYGITTDNLSFRNSQQRKRDLRVRVWLLLRTEIFSAMGT